MKQTCTFHCASCGAHFHSLSAFDSHRPMRCDLGALNSRTGEPLLEAWTAAGHCSLASGCRSNGAVIKELHPVTIYVMAGMEANRERLAAIRDE